MSIVTYMWYYRNQSDFWSFVLNDNANLACPTILSGLDQIEKSRLSPMKRILGERATREGREYTLTADP